MPFVALSKVAKNEVCVKTIFDYVRNLGLSAVVALAAWWKFSDLSHRGFSYYFDIFSGSVLAVASFSLFFLNMEFITHQFAKVNAPRWLTAILSSFAYLIAIQMLEYFSRGTFSR